MKVAQVCASFQTSPQICAGVDASGMTLADTAVVGIVRLLGITVRDIKLQEPLHRVSKTSKSTCFSANCQLAADSQHRKRLQTSKTCPSHAEAQLLPNRGPRVRPGAVRPRRRIRDASLRRLQAGAGSVRSEIQRPTSNLASPPSGFGRGVVGQSW